MEKEKKTMEIRKSAFITLITVIVILVICQVWTGIVLIQTMQKNEEFIGTDVIDDGLTEYYEDEEVLTPPEETEEIDTSKMIILYDGIEINPEATEPQNIGVGMDSNDESKYNIEYYQYSEDSYIGMDKGNLIDEGDSRYRVLTEGTVAISAKYNALPRTIDMATLDSEFFDKNENLKNKREVTGKEVDLDNDGKKEYIVSVIDDEDGNYASALYLFDSEYNLKATLAKLDKGIYSEEGMGNQLNYESINVDDTLCLDIDHDGIMEILVLIPSKKGEYVNIVEYNQGKITGKTEISTEI